MLSTDKLLSLKEVSRYLGISKTTLWKLTKAGEIETYRIGNRVLVGAEQLRKYLDKVVSKVSAEAAESDGLG